MLRGPWSRMACVLACTGASGCSLLLDWDIKPDAGLDPTACAYKEPNDTLATAQPLVVTDTGPAGICIGGDHDFYRFTVNGDTETVTIVISFDISGSQDLDINLYDAAGTVLGTGVTFGSPEERLICPGASPACPQLTTGDYILEVLGGSAAVTNLYTISLSILP